MLFRENVLGYCIENKVPSFGDKRLQFQVTLYPRDKRIQDIDNRIKALFDALEGLAYDSDSQIDVLIVQRGEIKKGGGCLVMLEVLEDNK
jgi:crossover junction endodeoxyribonuclease RusA